MVEESNYQQLHNYAHTTDKSSDSSTYSNNAYG